MNTMPMVPVDDAKLDAVASPPRVGDQLQSSETPPEATGEAESLGCPLQTAMRQVAEAAVTQHVLYAEGVYQPRDGLLHEMGAWLRLHELVRSGICPATRGGSGAAVDPGDLEIALASVPVEMRAQVAASIRVCGRRNRGEGCPLEIEPAGSLIE